MRETKQPKTVYAYIGKGKRFIAGVPARDLNAQEWNALTPETREMALREKVFEIVQPKKVDFETENKE